MFQQLRRRWRLAGLLAVIALVAAACGGSGDTGTNDGGSGQSIFISGSSTVEPISARVAEAFVASRPEVEITVEGPGTGDGFAKFCNGETDISDASRAIKDSEKERCAANGVEYVELLVAIDGLSVITSHDNDKVSCLGYEDLYALLGPESIGFTKWSDANDLAAELGARHAPYPDEDLVVTAPGEESGTYDSFVELVIEPIAEERGQEPATRPDYTASANDNVIIDGIAGSPYSLGWVGFAFYTNSTERVNAIAIDGGDGTCITPTPETIADGSYPISRPLYIYVNKGKAAEKPILAEFVDFYLSDEGLKAVSAAGYVELDDYEPTRQAWQSR